MRKKLLLLAIATVLACVTAATGLAAGSTQVTHFSFTTPRHQLCGIWGTAVVHGTSVFRDTGNGTYFMSGTLRRRLHGRQWKINHALRRRAADANVAGRDRRAGGDGHDHDYLRGSVREVFDHRWSDLESSMLGLSPSSMSSSTPAIQTIRWVTSSPRRCLTYTGHIPTSKAAAARSSCRTCKARRAATAGGGPADRRVHPPAVHRAPRS